jgi:hypothetical protein
VNRGGQPLEAVEQVQRFPGVPVEVTRVDIPQVIVDLCPLLLNVLHLALERFDDRGVVREAFEC